MHRLERWPDKGRPCRKGGAMSTDPIEQFKEVIRSYGLIPPSVFTPGKIHRIDRNDKPKGHKSGYCKLFNDGNGGIFGDFSRDISETWQANRDKPFTSAEQEDFNRRVEESKRQAESEKKERAEQAAGQSVVIWRKTRSCTTHGYCKKKRIEPDPARMQSAQAEECRGWFWTSGDGGLEELEGNLLLLPLYNIDGELRGLQAIDESGKKSLIKGLDKKGLFIPVTGGKLPADYKGQLYIAEGFATAATIREATGTTTLASVDAGNIIHVARAWRRKCALAEITICGDVDKSGIGQKKANEAAMAVGGLVALPPFTNEELAVDSPPSDWNDYAILHGTETVKQILTEASRKRLSDYESTVKELATLKLFEYDRMRKEKAKTLGVQLKTLDAEVNSLRKDGTETEHLPFTEVEPHPDPIDPAQLLNEVSETIRKFIVLDKDQADAVALWVAFTWFIDAVEFAPIIVISAPERACGKSQLLTVIGKMSCRPLATSNMRAATLFRITEKWHPAILIDEADTFIKTDEELAGLINAGHTRDNAFAWRLIGADFEPKSFNVWGAKAFAGISLEKHLPDATISRAIVINLRRKLPYESVSRLRGAECSLFDELSAKLARFAEDYSQQIRNRRPTLPEELSDRAQDNWEPLLAIAACADAEWVHRAIQAALKLSGECEESASTSNRLLADIQYVFEYKELEKISTINLINALTEDEEKPWATYNRGKRISPKQIALHLKGYGVESKSLRIDNRIVKGFERSQFDEVFKRYLTDPLPNLRLQSYISPEVNNHADLNVTAAESVTAAENKEVTPKPAPALSCNRVTAKSPISGVAEKNNSTHIRI
jgi:putative DNA primase/helicase